MAGVPVDGGGSAKWRSSDTAHGLRRGDEVIVRAGDIVKGDRAIVDLGAGRLVTAQRVEDSELEAFRGHEAEGDARILSIAMNRDGTRERLQWRDACSRMRESKFEDWPVPGPRTAK